MALPYDHDQNMPPPDWGRVLVNTAQKKAPSGDPTLWGGTVETAIDNDFAGDPATVRTVYGSQIILAQAADRYSRSWSIIGNLTMTPTMWRDTGSGGGDLEVYLSITQGIEKVTIEHRISLSMQGGELGLCNTQSTVVGGPYLPAVDGTQETRAFAAIGALIGNTINIRGVFVRSSAERAVPSARLSVLLAPAAAGAGI